MRSCRNLVVVVALVVAGSMVSYADDCQAGALSDVLAAGTCTIGGLTFDFTGTTSGWAGYNSANTVNGVTQGTVVQPGDINFLPVVLGNQAGFTLNTNLSASGSSGSNQFNNFQFFYGVSTTDGSATLLAVSSSGNGTTSGGFGIEGDENSYGAGYASIYAIGCNTQFVCTTANSYWQNGASGYSAVPLDNPVSDLTWYGYTSFYAGAWTLSGGVAGSSISSGTVLYQQVSADSFLRDDVQSVPEPATLALLGTGLMGLGWRRFRK